MTPFVDNASSSKYTQIDLDAGQCIINLRSELLESLYRFASLGVDLQYVKADLAKLAYEWV